MGGQLPQLHLAEAPEPVHAARTSSACTLMLSVPLVNQVVNCRSCGWPMHKSQYMQHLVCTIHLKSAPKDPNLTLCRSSQVVKCRSCGRSTHKQEYTQWFHNVTAAALREHAAAQPHATLGDRMKAINAAIRKTCNRDEGASP